MTDRYGAVAGVGVHEMACDQQSVRPGNEWSKDSVSGLIVASQ